MIMIRPSQPEAWVSLLPADPRPWILESGEPAARLLALTALNDCPESDREVKAARSEALADPGFLALAARLPDWETEQKISGHNSPAFAPNLLNVLADLGARGGDLPVVERLLDQMMAHQDKEGRFQTLGRWRGQDNPAWGALLCDSHAIAEVLARFGRGRDRRTRRALECALSDLANTDQGQAWPCRPDPRTKFRGPGRKSDCCPQVSLEALRAFSYLSENIHPATLLKAARACLYAWRERAVAKPYMFGHGRQFKTAKWPSLWYDVHSVLDALNRYPALWKGRLARAEDRRSLAEMAACLAAYNFGLEGRVTPKSCYQGFAAYSFGQKKGASPWATAKLCAVLKRLNDLASDIKAVNVLKLRSSKGGAGQALPPK